MKLEYEKLVVKDLKEICKNRGVSGYSTLTRDELIALCEESEIDYEKKNAGELKQICKDRGIKGYSKLRKPELVKLCQESELGSMIDDSWMEADAGTEISLYAPGIASIKTRDTDEFILQSILKTFEVEEWFSKGCGCSIELSGDQYSDSDVYEGDFTVKNKNDKKVGNGTYVAFRGAGFIKNVLVSITSSRKNRIVNACGEE